MALLRSIFWRENVAESKPQEKKFDPLGLLECRGDHLGGGEAKRKGRNGSDNGIVRRQCSVGNSAAAWSELLPELVGEIMRLVEANGEQWPQRQNVVACGGVCKQWKEAVQEAVEISSVRQPGNITFTSSLKQPGPPDAPFQCLVKRNKKNSAFHLYLTQSQSFTDEGKFLLAAKKYRRGMHSEYIISFDPHDLSQGSKSYVGKIRANILGTKFEIYDSQPPHNGAKSSTRGASKRIGSKQISPQVSARNFEVAHVSYKFNLFKSKGPRRMECALTPPSAVQTSKEKTEISDSSTIILKNKAPRWHEHLQCWCLNFHGRVTVASVKNFQLVASDGKGDRETVLLQFGKVADDTFTMDYRYPLSPFQAFAICLTSFGSKMACE